MLFLLSSHEFHFNFNYTNIFSYTNHNPVNSFAIADKEYNEVYVLSSILHIVDNCYHVISGETLPCYLRQRNVNQLDGLKKQHLEKTGNWVFLSLSKTIQNELLDWIFKHVVIWLKNYCLEGFSPFFSVSKHTS